MSTLDAPDNRRKKGGRQVARPNRPWTQKELASRHAYNAAGVMLTRADMKELGSTDNYSDDGEYDAKRDAALSYDVAIAEMRRRKQWREKLTAAKRVEFIGNCMMIEGDCLTIMPQIGRVDAVVTDPPYGMALDTNGKRFSGGSKTSQARRGSGRVYPGIIGDDAPFDPSVWLQANECILWGFNHFSERLPQGGGLVWIKRKDDAFGSFLSDAELGWEKGKKGVFCFRSFPQTMALEREHPTQKPLDLMVWCVSRIKSRTILDPYMGSGTTGVACVKTGRSFIGIELDPDYFEIACRRVREAYAQPDLLIDAPKAAPEVQEAFEL